ncbi:hypothetical protein Bca52824_082733 [Brassica carinata]|uniref:Uncharacterized protein n=1 Tax=Brassica carinata TaxID=52824 RepID=A0A8X7PKY6_BRACI|nr:hypothetical protein Bca52824_082733 [Brassica carinata]
MKTRSQPTRCVSRAASLLSTAAKLSPCRQRRALALLHRKPACRFHAMTCFESRPSSCSSPPDLQQLSRQSIGRRRGICSVVLAAGVVKLQIGRRESSLKSNNGGLPFICVFGPWITFPLTFDLETL